MSVQPVRKAPTERSRRENPNSSRPRRPRPETRRRQRPSASRADRSKLIVVGATKRVKQVAHALGRLTIDVECIEDIPEKIDARTVAFVVVPPLPGPSSVEGGLHAIRQKRYGDAVSVFVIVDDDTADATVRRLYASGATAVTVWPREGLLLPGLVAELLGISLIRGGVRTPAKALKRTLDAHLRLTPWATSGVRVEAAARGEVWLDGSISSLWRKRELEQLVGAVPGVRRVDSGGLIVQPTGVPDAKVARTVRSTLRNTTRVDDATVSVAVHGGRVALAGTVADRRELRRILDLVTQVQGVREIINTLVVSTQGRKQDRSTARRLGQTLSRWFRREPVDVSVFSRVAVLTGKVSRLTRRLEIERLVESDPAISRVINKIDIA